MLPTTNTGLPSPLVLSSHSRFISKQQHPNGYFYTTIKMKSNNSSNSPLLLSLRRRFNARNASTIPNATTTTTTSAAAAASILLPNNTVNTIPVSRWLFVCSGMVAGMIHVGGLTRLTQSGLSMTTWSITGSFPPVSHDDWMREYTRYQQFPEYQQRQKSMTLDEFKFIYYWEYGHRMLGRVVGVGFVLPWIYFSARGRIPSNFQSRMALLCGMGGTQGLIGWWMVKSGLGEDRRGDTKQIRVSPYRLSTHLTMATATYATLIYTGLQLSSSPQSLTALREYVKRLSPSEIKAFSKLRYGAMAVTALTGITIVSGAFVAGNDAGRAYNTYPLMSVEEEDYLIPPNMYTEFEPWWRNMAESTLCVQFNHRWLGTTTAVSSLALMGWGLSTMPPTLVKRGLLFMGAASLAQMSLGIVTLLNYVPIWMAASHQMGSIVVLTSGIYTTHALRFVPMVTKKLVKL